MIWFGWVLWHINYCRLFNGKSSLYIYTRYIGFGLFWFYGISPFVGYLMSNRWRVWNGSLRIGKWIESVENLDHSDHSSVEIGQNTQKNSGDVRRLTITPPLKREKMITMIIGYNKPNRNGGKQEEGSTSEEQENLLKSNKILIISI